MYQRVLVPSSAPRAAVVLAHGFGEHTHLLSWQLAADAFVEAGFVVAGFDYRGHGRSPGRRGHIARWQDLRDDFTAFRADIAASHAGVPLFTTGLSLGSIVVLNDAMDHPDGLGGVIAAAAPTGEIKMSKLAASLAGGLSRVAPLFPLRPSLRLGSLSRDEVIGERYLADPLFHQRATARGLHEGLKAIQLLRSRAAELTAPLLMLHGDADGIAPADGTFFKSVGSVDKTYRLFGGAKHNLFIETNRAEIFGAMIDWINRRV